jgi:hypothetical protein
MVKRDHHLHLPIPTLWRRTMKLPRNRSFDGAEPFAVLYENPAKASATSPSPHTAGASAGDTSSVRFAAGGRRGHRGVMTARRRPPQRPRRPLGPAPVVVPNVLTPFGQRACDSTRSAPLALGPTWAFLRQGRLPR